jgi:hypothetical protein
VSDLGSTTGIVALAAAAVALAAFVLAIILAVKLRRVRAAQSFVLGDSGTGDVAELARRLQDEFMKLSGRLDSLGQRFEARAAEADGRLDGTIAHFAVIRYDAYNEMSGRQSSSIALLDSHRSGIVLSSILHREQARLYAKQIVNGRPQLDLSPEEQEAVDAAIAGEHRAGESAAG